MSGALPRVLRGRPAPVAVAVATALALVLLGPALAPGLVQSFDLVTAPDARFTPFALGAGVVAPRAVPSDAVVAALSVLLPTSLVQKVLLVAVLVGAGAGCARLAGVLVAGRVGPGAAATAQVVAAVAGTWNPFVAERLVLGQWTVLVGWAVLPWATASVLSEASAGDGRPRTAVVRACGWVALATLGGANTVVVVLPAVLLAAVALRRVALAVAVLLTAVAGSACWWLPALVRIDQASGQAGTQAFVARADNPLGLLATLLAGAGSWNRAVVPPGREVALVAAAAAALAVVVVVAALPVLRRREGAAVLVPGLVGLGWCLLQAAPATRDAVSALLAAVPGGGLLRDGQKVLAWWVLLTSCAAGATAARLVAHGTRTAALVVLLALAPPALLPAAAWGVAGRVAAVEVPPDYGALAAEVDRAPAGVVASLPWGQYRAYAWNGGRVSLDLQPRLLDRRVLVDDSLRVRDDLVVPGEDPVAASVSRALADGEPVDAALRAAGVRLVVVDLPAGDDALRELDAGGAERLWQGRRTVLLDLGEQGRAGPPDRVDAVQRAGWAVSLCAWGAVAAGLVVAATRRRNGATGG